jgi:hypothetical protein
MRKAALAKKARVALGAGADSIYAAAPPRVILGCVYMCYRGAAASLPFRCVIDDESAVPPMRKRMARVPIPFCGCS